MENKMHPDVSVSENPRKRFFRWVRVPQGTMTFHKIDLLFPRAISQEGSIGFD